jgi:hypothetical protein
MKKTAKLHLSTETLRRLTADDLSGIAGGASRSVGTAGCSNVSKIVTSCLAPATNVDCATWGCHEATTACHP